MTINISDRNNLIKYSLQQADCLIDEVNFLIENKKYLTAANCIYYGIFYALSALALLHKFETSKHRQLIGWFNKFFVRESIFENNIPIF